MMNSERDVEIDFKARVESAKQDFVENGIPLGAFMDYCFLHKLKCPPGVGLGAMRERVPVGVFLSVVGVAK